MHMTTENVASNVYESPNGTRYWTPIVPHGYKPYVGARFRSLDEAIIMYEEYAEIAGFGTRLGTTKVKKGITTIRYILCSKAKTPKTPECNQTGDMSNDKSRRLNIKSTGCNACVKLKLINGTQEYEVHQFNEVHNHGCVSIDNTDLTRKKRKLNYNTKQFIANCRIVNIGPTKAHKLHVVLKGGHENVHGTVTDYKNWGRDIRNFVTDGDAQMVVDKLTERSKNLEDYTFECRIVENELQSLFWADKVSKINYKVFGDVLAFDATYHTNIYDMIMVNFIGVDNHKKVTIFGAGLLHNETIESYTWILQMFLKAHTKQPLLVLTDQDAAMKQAVNMVFDNSIHRLCMWHVTDKLPSKIDGDVLKNTNIKMLFHKLVWDVYLEPTRFEQKWHQLLDEHNLNNNKWLTDMYEIRHQWAPCYFRDLPMRCLMKTTSRCESVNHMFKSISSGYNTLVQFMLCYETSIDGLRKEQRVLEHMTATTNLTFRTPQQIERHANLIYTRGIFLKVQKEIYKSTMFCYIAKRNVEAGVFKVAHQGYTSNFMNEENIPNYTHEFKVTFDAINLDVLCDCMGYTRIGYLCCHIFCVFRHNNIHSIPSKYIHQRWRRDAVPAEVHSISHRYSSNHSQTSIILHLITNNVDMCIDRIRGNPDKLNEFDQQIQLMKDKIFEEFSADPTYNKKKVTVIPEIISHKQPEAITVTAPKGIRNKGCGTHKRLVGPKEVAKKKAKKPKRKCNYCGFMVRGHDSRNCPLKKGTTVHKETTSEEDVEDYQDSSDEEVEE